MRGDTKYIPVTITDKDLTRVPSLVSIVASYIGKNMSLFYIPSWKELQKRYRGYPELLEQVKICITSARVEPLCSLLYRKTVYMRDRGSKHYYKSPKVSIRYSIPKILSTPTTKRSIFMPEYLRRLIESIGCRCSLCDQYNPHVSLYKVHFVSEKGSSTR